MPGNKLSEPWLRDTLKDVPPVQRAVLHALELALEDINRSCASLTDEQMNARPAGLAPVAFHLRHIARSLDRLLTYAEGRSLIDDQLAALRAELDPGAIRNDLFTELDGAVKKSAARIRSITVDDLGEARSVGKRQLPTTVAGLLVHIADHTQRHVGQAITTARIVTGASAAMQLGMRPGSI